MRRLSGTCTSNGGARLGGPGLGTHLACCRVPLETGWLHLLPSPRPSRLGRGGRQESLVTLSCVKSYRAHATPAISAAAATRHISTILCFCLESRRPVSPLLPARPCVPCPFLKLCSESTLIGHWQLFTWFSLVEATPSSRGDWFRMSMTCILLSNTSFCRIV